MDSINLKDLSYYQDDEKGLRDFQRPYLIPSLFGMIIAIAGFLVMISEMEARNHHRGGKVIRLDKLWFYFEKIANEAGIGLGIQWYLPAAIFAGGLILFAATMIFMVWATPVSGISKMKMEKYWNADHELGEAEIVYVDRASKTYFRRVFAARSRDPDIPIG